MISVHIEVDHLSKIHKRGDGEDVVALDDITFRIASGEFVAIRGASGSGKSSLLSILGCLDRQTSGVYLLGGIKVSGLADAELSSIRSTQIGFVFQAFNLLSRTTALENVELPMIYGSASVDREKCASALTRVGLGARLNHYPTELSGGEQQRVAIARALINDPALILADEPTGNLDEASGAEIMALLVSLHREGRTVVLVTHDKVTASHASRVITLNKGQVISDVLVSRNLHAKPA
jgi:putative ABC transport system ATP-binding protein